MIRAAVRRVSSSVGHAAVALLLAGGLVSGGMTVLVVAANQTLDASPQPRPVAGPQVSPLPGTLVVDGPTPTATGPGGPHDGITRPEPGTGPSGSGGGPAAPGSTTSPTASASTQSAPSTPGPAPSSSPPEPTTSSPKPTPSSPKPTPTSTPTTSCPHDTGDDDTHSSGNHRGKGHDEHRGRGCGHHQDHDRALRSGPLEPADRAGRPATAGRGQ